MRPVDTMPKEGRFLVFWGSGYVQSMRGSEETKQWAADLERQPGGSPLAGWSPIPDADSRVVTRAELEELIAAARHFERWDDLVGSYGRARAEERFVAIRKAVGLE